MNQSEKKFEMAKIGYETAFQIWIYEGNSIWAKFNAMLVANSIVIAAFTQIEPEIAQLILIDFGIALCWI